MAISADEVRIAFDQPLLEAPERLRPFFAESVSALEGLDLAFGYLAAGIVDEALKRMTMWHKEFAPLGYKSWAELYFAEVQRKNQFTLPNVLTPAEETYLKRWHSEIHSLIERSSAVAETPAKLR